MIKQDNCFQIDTHELMQTIIRNSYDGIFVTDGTGRIITYNNSFERIAEIQGTDIIGKNVSYLAEIGCKSCSLVQRVLEKGQTLTKAIENHQLHEVLVTASPVFDQRGKITLVVCNFRDLTELRLLKAGMNSVEIVKSRFHPAIPESLPQNSDCHEVIGRSKVMQELSNFAERIAKVESTVLITGESGVGKDVLARLIHHCAFKNDERPFTKVCCGAIPETLLESELFGYEGGSFTGAKKEGKPGIFELAGSGTVFLDEIGEISPSIQVKLLSVLQDRQFIRVGGVKPVKMNARVIAATNQDLKKAIQEGRFRSDLYYRLNVIPIFIPPLRERIDDIVPLIEYFLSNYNKKYGLQKFIQKHAIEKLKSYSWPGNVRELSNVVERLAVLAPDDGIGLEDLPWEIRFPQPSTTAELTMQNLPLKDILQHVEVQVISQTLNRYSTLKEAADALGLDLSTLTRKKQKYFMSKR